MKKGTKFKRIGAKRLADKTPLEQMKACEYGDDFTGKEWALEMAEEFGRTVHEIDRQRLTLHIFKPLAMTRPPKASHATIKDFEAWHRTPAMLALASKELVSEVANICAEAAKTGNPQALRALADAIEAVGKRSTRTPVPWRQLREFILVRFRGFKRKQEFTGTFSEARVIIANHFSDFPDDPQLRRMFTEHGVAFPKCKPGRTAGTRNRLPHHLFQ